MCSNQHFLFTIQYALRACFLSHLFLAYLLICPFATVSNFVLGNIVSLKMVNVIPFRATIHTQNLKKNKYYLNFPNIEKQSNFFIYFWMEWYFELSCFLFLELGEKQRN
ncbi:hypothetical protein DM860_002159 [Cuscuta australis]|uniref:Uncharacterized protein n=1 Tax=Cuscuta australis TaxID=267555 RepID=A0A328DZE6_9ASTE|nr:hypothetical protein DM860_002159 [Cuscuta australis]